MIAFPLFTASRSGPFPGNENKRVENVQRSCKNPQGQEDGCHSCVWNSGKQTERNFATFGCRKNATWINLLAFQASGVFIPLKKSVRAGCNMLEASLRKWRRYHWFRREITSEKWAQKFHTDDVHYQDLGSTFDWLKRISHAARPIRRTTRIWVVNVIRMGFLRLFLRRHFAGKLVLASWNVGCFLRLARSAPTLFSVGESCRWWL